MCTHSCFSVRFLYLYIFVCILCIIFLNAAIWRNKRWRWWRYTKFDLNIRQDR